MPNVTITLHKNGNTGEYRAQVEGSDHIGRLTWVDQGKIRAAEHTLVPPQIGGQGVAAQLVNALIDVT